MNKLEQLVNKCQEEIDARRLMSNPIKFMIVANQTDKLNDLDLLEILQSKPDMIRHMTVNHGESGISIRTVIMEVLADYLMFVLKNK